MNAILHPLAPKVRAAVPQLTREQLQEMIARIEAQVKALKAYAKQRHTDRAADSNSWRMN